jgi:hypothetical protein
VNDIQRGVFFMFDLGNQIGGGDVDEVAGGKRPLEKLHRR